MLPDNVFKSSRAFPFSRNVVFQAFANPDVLARWWGPAGFTNTFDTFDFRVGGEWNFTMHGPDGRDYPNRSVFDEIVEPSKIVLRHIVKPEFTLTMTYEDDGDGCVLTWEQAFESAEVKNSLLSVIEPANEQNYDRLAAVLKEG